MLAREGAELSATESIRVAQEQAGSARETGISAGASAAAGVHHPVTGTQSRMLNETDGDRREKDDSVRVVADRGGIKPGQHSPGSIGSGLRQRYPLMHG